MAEEKKKLIQFKNIVKSFEDGQVVLKGVSLDIYENEFVTLLGPSGCGKTTLLRILGGFLQPSEGKVLFDGEDIVSVPPYKREINTVFQKYALFPHMDVYDNIAFGLTLKKEPKDVIEQKVMRMLRLVSLEDYAHRNVTELSGGQQQRIGVLRALAASPPIVLMDEPFGALDPMTRAVLQDEVRSIQQKLNKTVIFVTHDMDEALKLADIIIFMDGGEIVQMASPEEMLEHPATDQVRSFLGKHAPDAPAPSTVEHFMRTNLVTVKKNRGVLECAERMARSSVDSLLVTDEEKRYVGTISIADIRRWGRELTSIEPMVRQTARTVRVGDDAKESFDYLLESGAGYVVVLNEDDTIAGIVTKTSVARSVAENLWGAGS